LVVVQILPALNNGGVERGTVEMANYLAENGHTSIVISAGGIMQEKLSSTVQHIIMDVGKKSLLSLLLINKLKKFFMTKNVDIVHARSRLPAWLVYKAIARIKKQKPKFITTIHGLYSVKRYSSIMARGDNVIAVSQTAANYVMENYPHYLKQKPHIIYRGIDPKEFSYGHQPELHWLTSWNKENPELIDQKTVLLPGRLTALKGVKDLLTWLKAKENDALLLLTANPDSDKYAVRLDQWFNQQGVQNRVKWVGFQKSMADLYAVVDVVVSTSTRAESFGRTVVESLAVGTPVVGYNHGGVGEILNELFPQGCVEVGNTQQLSSQLNSVLITKPQVADKQTFLLDNMLSQTLKVYQEAINDR
jgi:glycosyltransferase involved in cell wall biosynthesis